MKKRQLSNDFLNNLQGKYHSLLELVQKDDTLDMEFRGDSVIVYYRGGKLVELKENGVLIPLDNQYGNAESDLSFENIQHYCSEGKRLIDTYQTSTKNNLGEKEISQRIVAENNYSPYSSDTDYFIVDMEYNDGAQFDLVALKWPSTRSAHINKKCSISIIETKQGMTTLRTSTQNPGLKKHYADYSEFITKNNMEEFCADMLTIFKQKCILGLIRDINEPSSSLQIKEDTEFNLLSDMEFIAVLANYKRASTNLHKELQEMEVRNDFKFATSSFVGYGLYINNMISFDQMCQKVK